MNTTLLVCTILAGWCITSVVLGVAVGKQIKHLNTLNTMSSNATNAIHRRCVNRLIDVTEADHTVRVLREAAKDWDDPVSQGYLGLLARERYRPGGPSMPSIWLNARADKIEEESR